MLVFRGRFPFWHYELGSIRDIVFVSKIWTQSEMAMRVLGNGSHKCCSDKTSKRNSPKMVLIRQKSPPY